MLISNGTPDVEGALSQNARSARGKEAKMCPVFITAQRESQKIQKKGDKEAERNYYFRPKKETAFPGVFPSPDKRNRINVERT